MANPSVVVDFLANTKQLVDGVKQLGSETSKAGDATKKVDWKRVAAWGGAAVAVGAGVKFMKSASDATVQMAKDTMALQRATNLDTETASAWVETLKVRNISIQQFQTSLVKLSKLMDTYRLAQADAKKTLNEYMDAQVALAPIIAKGGDAGKDAAKSLDQLSRAAGQAQERADKAGAPFKALGVNLADVRKGNTEAVLMQLSDGLKNVENPATRTADAVKLFGKQGLSLLPILMKGSKALKDQLGLAKKYGATLSDKTVKAVADLAAKQRELKIIQDGVKTQVGSALVPAQVALYGSLLKLLQVVMPFTHNVKVMEGVLIAAGVAMGGYKVAVVATTLAESKLFMSLLKSIGTWIADTAAKVADTVATWAAVAGTLALVAAAAALVIGIAAVIAIGVLLYKNWDKITEIAGKAWAAIKAGAMAALAWLKSNWPLVLGILTGPIGLAVVAVVKNWKAIKDAVSSAVTWVLNFVKAHWPLIVGAMLGPLGLAIAGVVTKWDTVKRATSAAWAAIRGAVTGAVGAIGNALLGLVRALGNTVGAVGREATKIADAIKRPINAVIAGWNKLALTIPKVSIPSVKIPHVGTVGGGSFGGQTFHFPQIPKLATGGVFSSPTLAMVGEGAGREVVAPETLLRQIVGSMVPVVHVYIGDTELRDVVRVEVVAQDNALASSLLGGVA